MSGCANACAQHHTADIGLKGVKVRKGLKIVDGFDLYLGGGVSDQLELGILHKKGVPFGQLAESLEQLIREFHTHRQDGESFSAFWRRRLGPGEPEVVAPEELPTWRCEECGYLHTGQNSPGFCPRCAAVRTRFVVEDAVEAVGATAGPPSRGAA